VFGISLSSLRVVFTECNGVKIVSRTTEKSSFSIQF
jgi:hypothetical protein